MVPIPLGTHRNVRPYVSSTDHAQIVDMCKLVYNGTDRLPKVLDTLPSNVSAFVLHEDGRQDVLQGVGVLAAILEYACWHAPAQLAWSSEARHCGCLAYA